MNDLIFKYADVDDVPLILGFIRELAEAEAFPFPVTVSAEDLRENLFGPSSVAKTIIGFVGQKPVGFALFYETFSTTTGKPGIHLDDLFILPEYQNRGYGKVFLGHLAQIARERHCARFEWWALKTNVDAIRFFKRMGARQMDELLIFRTQGDNLDRLADSF